MDPSQSTPVADEAQIIEQYAPLVEGMVRRLQVPPALRDDARQEGFVGLIEAVRRYDTGSPVHFAVFAKMYVKGAILRRIYTRTQITETPAVEPRRGTSSDGDYEFESDVLSSLHLEAWMATLPLADAWLLRRMYWEDATSDDIAAELNVTRRRVNQIHTNLLRRGAIALGGEG